MLIKNIEYFIPTEELRQHLYDLSIHELLKILNIGNRVVDRNQLIDDIISKCRHNLLLGQEILGLSDTIYVPDGLDEDGITEYISDETGYFINGWNYEEETV